MQATSNPETEWEGEFDPLADPEERRVLFAALDSFRQYRRTAHLNTTHRRRQAFYALPSAHWQMLAEPPFSILDHLSNVDDAIDTNASIADAILDIGLASFGLPATPPSHPDGDRLKWHDTATPADVNKAHSTIRQFYRDWSHEGATEREVCYEPVRRALREFAQTAGGQGGRGARLRVLVPGAGLGRLVFDLCQDGFDTEGNEISYHQLLASNWILNHTKGAQQHALHPFALHFANVHSREQQMRRVLIPDIHPGMALHHHHKEPGRPGTMSMSASDFTVSYRGESNRAAFDAVATVFFIDTAPNLIRYLEAIYNCLRPGGLWVNVGPLLWHFGESTSASTPGHDSGSSSGSGIGEPGSVELTSEEVRLLIERMGFAIEEYRADLGACGYIQDTHSMLQNVYRPVFWVARRQ